MREQERADALDLLRARPHDPFPSPRPSSPRNPHAQPSPLPPWQNPLRETDRYTEDEWFHRFTDEPPLPGDVLRLRPGATQTFELGCNRAFTAYRNPAVKDRGGGPNNTYACNDADPGRVSLGD